ncbi:hypothetical protein EX895_003536 [Sporisorium graminicola]|uniref:Uncharacterized protein n=1 Tax=Sporisorium graminicola TaxID=280036 RepID=A0A4U7KXE6_9BASI|nr:hypothetical protein EX895_003536 [Sporisorium graminicola]TKY87522.1 hypothetical protein EX895_003536 [Sporisorium graminicola]
MQGDTLFRCITYLQAAGLTRQAAMMVGDVRLKPSQSRFLLERLIYEFKLPSIPGAKRHDSIGQVSLPSTSAPSFAAADARVAVREMCDAMMSLMADGVSFKRKVVNRMLKLLSLTRARSRVVRLLRAAQRRAQIQSLSAAGQDELRAAGGFSRLRSEEVKPPQVVSTKTMEEAIRVLCGQDGTGARTAYELLCALDQHYRTPAMYDALMTRYGSAPTTPVDSTGQAYATVDEQLWREIRELMGGPTLHTLSARIACHTRKRRLDLLRSDLDFLRSSSLGGMHDLTEGAKLNIVRCCIESGSLLAGFRYASSFLSASGDTQFQSNVVTTLLRSAQHIHIPPSAHSSAPSRAQLLKRFLRHYSHLHAKHPQLKTELRELKLFIQLLEAHQQWIETSTLWNMLRVVGGHFGNRDQRLAGVLEAFSRVFEARGEVESAKELRALIGRLQQVEAV